jgi:S-adenosylmethionine uptake transporter
VRQAATATHPRISPARSAPVLMVLSSFLFALMGVCVKLASVHYATGEIVFARGLVGAVAMIGVARWQAGTLRTGVPAMHFWRGISGVTSLTLWFYAISALPLATAVTLNYMSSVWMALFLIGGAVMLGARRVDGRLVATVLLGFLGVTLVLRPTMEHDQLWPGLLGLLSGMLSAMAYLQITALGRAGEPDYRVVFYFSVGGMLAGAAMMLWSGSVSRTLAGVHWLLATGVLATLAQMLMTRAYTIGRPLVNASLQYLGIAWSFLFGIVLFGDDVTLTAILGMILIVAAGLFATLLRSRAAPRDVASASGSDT